MQVAAEVQETGGQFAADSGEEYYWKHKVIDSDLKMDFQEELSLRNLGHSSLTSRGVP